MIYLHKMKYDLKGHIGHFYVIYGEVAWFLKSFRPFDQITTLTYVHICPGFQNFWPNLIIKTLTYNLMENFRNFKKNIIFYIFKNIFASNFYCPISLIILIILNIWHWIPLMFTFNVFSEIYLVFTYRFA